MYYIGVDSGSSFTKGILYDGEFIIDKIIVPTGANPKNSIREVFLALKKDYLVYTVATGYGRDLLEEANKRVTEITCHGKGATFLDKRINAVIDIGGQDSKVILVDEYNNIIDFLMNDKCAAGTGRFVDVTMKTLNRDVCDIDRYVEGAEPTSITSMCTVFAESEVISSLAKDISGESIALGIIHSICERTSYFARRLPIQGNVFFSGGLAQSEVMRCILEDKLGLKVITNSMSQFAGAIGAAIIGYEQLSK